jgi:NAD(P)-dependent dehydrogenase (short-subunit alcohol dehydrogenase family)
MVNTYNSFKIDLENKLQKTVLITGASSGIGKATAHAFLREGNKVYTAARRLDRMEDLAQAGAVLLSLDLTDDASIVAAVDQIKQQQGRVDVLINNAGYGSYGALEDVPMSEARRQVEVNVFGLARLCQLILPMMRGQKSGKIVNITSIGGKIWEPFGAWYHATKFAVEGLSDCLRMEVAPFGIDVIVIEPGAIRTEWSGIAVESLRTISGKTPYAPYALQHAKMIEGSMKSSMTSEPAVVAQAILNAVKASSPKTRYAVGGGARLILFMRSILSDKQFDRLMRRAASSAK